MAPSYCSLALINSIHSIHFIQFKTRKSQTDRICEAFEHNLPKELSAAWSCILEFLLAEHCEACSSWEFKHWHCQNLPNCIDKTIRNAPRPIIYSRNLLGFCITILALDALLHFHQTPRRCLLGFVSLSQLCLWKKTSDANMNEVSGKKKTTHELYTSLYWTHLNSVSKLCLLVHLFLRKQKLLWLQPQRLTVISLIWWHVIV